jgi:hypothetical protein
MRPHRRDDAQGVPVAYLVTDGRPRPPVVLRHHLRETFAPLFAPLRDGARTALVLLFGLWPLWAAFALGMALIWGGAMASSP